MCHIKKSVHSKFKLVACISLLLYYKVGKTGSWGAMVYHHTPVVSPLSPMPKCHCFSHSRASRIQKKILSPNHGGRQYFSVFYDPYALKSVFSALPLLVRNYRENSVFVSIKFSRVFDYFNHLELLFVPKKLWSSHQTSATDLLYLTWKIYMSIKSIFVWM